MADSLRIFVSHSHKDNEWCGVFVAALRAHGADVWYDEQNLDVGVLSDEIFREIQECPVFIPVLSPAAVTSEWAKREGFAAIHLRDAQVERLRSSAAATEPTRQILPVIARKCEVPLWWIGFKRFADSDDGSLPPEEAAGRVAQALRLPPAPVSAGAREVSPVKLPVKPPETSVEARHDESTFPDSATVVGGVGPFDKVVASRAITDVFDERGRFLVQYPQWLIVGLGLAGIVVVTITGFFGYPVSDPGDPLHSLDGWFREPWLLYAWFCALFLVLQASVLRHPSLRPQLFATLTTTIVSAITAAIFGYVGVHLPSTRDLVLTSGGLRSAVPRPWLFALLNFGILAIFWFGTVNRWIGQRNIYEPDPRESVLAKLRVVAGDFVAATLLALLLAVVFQPDVFFAILGSSGRPNICLISWPLAPCDPGSSSQPFTLSTINFIQMLAYGDPALVLLGILIAAGGLGRHGAVGALQEVLDRFIRAGIRSPLIWLRTVLWPLLLLFGMIALALSSKDFQSYLHSERSPADVVTYALSAIALLLIALMSVVFSLALEFFRVRVAENTFRFIALIGFVILLTYWLFSLTLFIFNHLLLLLGYRAREPFITLDYSTYVSLGALVVMSAFLLLQRRRR